MRKKPNSVSYIFFYVIFSPDTWRLLIGFLLSIWIVPRIVPPDMSTAGRMMLYIMVLAIGWAASAAPANWICKQLKKWIVNR